MSNLYIAEIGFHVTGTTDIRNRIKNVLSYYFDTTDNPSHNVFHKTLFVRFHSDNPDAKMEELMDAVEADPNVFGIIEGHYKKTFMRPVVKYPPLAQ